MSNQLNILPSNKIELAGFKTEFRKDILATSLDGLSGKRVIFSTDSSKEQFPLVPLTEGISDKIPYLIQDFSPSPRERIIASIDSSCALIGETDEGDIYAGRVTTVFSTKGGIITYHRAGPIIFYLDPSTIENSFAPSFARKGLKSVLQDRSVAERSIRICLERKAQIQTANLLSDSIILVDGSLRGSMLEQKGSRLKDLELACEHNFNQLVGFSKASSLRVITSACAFLQTSKRNQVYIDLTDLATLLIPFSSSIKISVVKFSPGSSVFRLDTSSINIEDEAQIYSDLKYNDAFFRGYPETLRLAHHLSVLDSSTISSIRSYLAKEYEMIQVPSDDLRATILGRLV